MTESEQKRFEILLEEMNGKFDIVLEGHETIRQELRGEFNDIKEQQSLFMSLLKDSHNSLSEEIRAAGEKVDGHEDRISFLERKAA